MESDINRIIRREFPEIASGYHLPILARIEAISDAPIDGGISDHFRPMMAVDLIILDKRRNPVKDLPVFKAIPLPISFAGLERGHFAFPDPGCLCEVAFMYGMADQLFVRQVFGWGLSIPSVSPGDVLNQAAADVFEKTDAQGNKTRSTHGTILDDSLLYRLQALEAIFDLVNKTENIKGNSFQTIKGKLLVKAFGALRLLSGGIINLTAIDNINITTSADMMTTVCGNNKQTAKNMDIKVKENLTTTVVGENKNTAALFEVLASANARIKSSKVWVGSNTENVLGILSELHDAVKTIADELVLHKHVIGGGLTQVPNNAAAFTAQSTAVDALKARLDPIKE